MPRRGRSRKYGRRHYALAIPKQVWRHPNNRHRRLRRLAAAGAWQVRKHVHRMPSSVPFYGDTSLIADAPSSSLSSVIYFGAYFEYHEMHFLERYLRSGDACIDGGANIGAFSVFLGSLVGVTGRVEAFEPAPEACRKLEANVMRNAMVQVRVHQVGLGKRCGLARLTVDRDVANRVLVDGTAGSLRDVEVSLARLDEAVPRREYAVCKLDLEGSELDALRGATGMVDAGLLPVLIVEGLDHQLRRHGDSRRELWAFLEDRGYRLGVYDHDTGALSWHRPGSTYRTANVLAVHDTAVDRVMARAGLDPQAR